MLNARCGYAVLGITFMSALGRLHQIKSIERMTALSAKRTWREVTSEKAPSRITNPASSASSARLRAGQLWAARPRAAPQRVRVSPRIELREIVFAGQAAG